MTAMVDMLDQVLRSRLDYVGSPVCARESQRRILEVLQPYLPASATVHAVCLDQNEFVTSPDLAYAVVISVERTDRCYLVNGRAQVGALAEGSKLVPIGVFELRGTNGWQNCLEIFAHSHGRHLLMHEPLRAAHLSGTKDILGLKPRPNLVRS